MSSTKIAKVLAIATADAHGYGWVWQSTDGRSRGGPFVYFHDCLQDAKAKGYETDVQVGSQEQGAGTGTRCPRP